MSALLTAGVLGVHTPKGTVQCSVLYEPQSAFLRGGQEHKNLIISQFTFGSDRGDQYVQYAESGSTVLF